MLCFLDTSFLFKLYVPETDSAEAISILGSLQVEVAISALTDVEMASALHRRLSPEDAKGAHGRYRRNRSEGHFQELAIDSAVFLLAQELSEQHASNFLLRSLDAMHLATALRHGATSFATYDGRLAHVAKSMGMSVIPLSS